MMAIAADPSPFALDPSAVALLVIDMQRDFLEPGGFGASLGNDVARLRECIAPATQLLDCFRRHGLPVIHTRECHRPDLSDCPLAKHRHGPLGARIGDVGPMGRILVAGEPGAEIIADLAPRAGETVIDKPGKGAFYATDMGDRLAALGVSQLIFAGVTTEVCVQTTMREANDRGFECLLASDATASYIEGFREATIAMITAQGGIVGRAARTAAIVQALESVDATVHSREAVGR